MDPRFADVVNGIQMVLSLFFMTLDEERKADMAVNIGVAISAIEESDSPPAGEIAALRGYLDLL